MNKTQLKNKVIEILKYLKQTYPKAKVHLWFTTPFELLVSTVLAAQCTDERVNSVMVPLYKTKYKEPKDIVKDGLENFRSNIKSITFPNNKAKAILKMCQQLEENFGGKVPETMEELTKLEGVGRKSASVILGNCFHKKDVIIVDTHLKRVAERLGLIKNSDPDKIEQELKTLVPENEQFTFSLLIGEHGRQVCKARKPLCKNCILFELCPFPEKTM
ncbi:MAG: endonuclease III [Ignavibacteria bacterium]